MLGARDKEMRTGHKGGTLHHAKAHVKRIPAPISHEDSAIKDQRVKSCLLARVGHHRITEKRTVTIARIRPRQITGIARVFAQLGLTVLSRVMPRISES